MKGGLFDSAGKTVMLTGLLAGTLDAVAAMLVYQVRPLPLFRFIASGVFGADAFDGGLGMAFWGALFHYVIAFAWTLLFFFLYPRIHRLSGNRFINGILYGVIIWVIMNLVVLPVTNVRRAPLEPGPAAVGALILIFAVGLPVSLFTHRHYSRKKGTTTTLI